jgi:hypothetical protein
MDSGAKMLGLDDEFLGASGKGGGIIMYGLSAKLWSAQLAGHEALADPEPPSFVRASSRGSASESCLTVAIGARERALRIIAQQEEANTNGTFSSHSDPDLINPTIPTHIRSTYTQKLVMYGSTQTHSIGAKAALILGHVWRSIPVEKEDNYSLRGNQLRAAIEEDRAIGLIPFFIIGTGSFASVSLSTPLRKCSGRLTCSSSLLQSDRPALELSTGSESSEKLVRASCLTFQFLRIFPSTTKR